MKPILTLKKWLAYRDRHRDCTLCVMHATVSGKGAGTIEWLRHIGYSYHYLIEKDGTVTKCVPASKVAYHAGKSEGPGGPNCNEYSVGIAFVNWNDGKDPITMAQMVSAVDLVESLKAQLPLVWISTHFGISPGRKFDPRLFDVEKFAQSVGLKAWKRKDAVWRLF